MGLSASQARFLQLTARRSNLEYQAQQISYERLMLSSKLETAASEYEDAISNQKLQFTYNGGDGNTTVDLSYGNYKLYMNQQKEDFTSSQKKYYLVSSDSTKAKIICASEDEAATIIEQGPKVKKQVLDDDGNPTLDDSGAYVYQEVPALSLSDFRIIEDVAQDDENFQRCITDGTYYFATYEYDDSSEEYEFNAESWEELGSGAISQVLDTTDDSEAQAKYDNIEATVEKDDKALELQLNQIENERNAVNTEIDSVKKTIENNVEGSFNIFS